MMHRRARRWECGRGDGCADGVMGAGWRRQVHGWRGGVTQQVSTLLFALFSTSLIISSGTLRRSDSQFYSLHSFIVRLVAMNTFCSASIIFLSLFFISLL